MTETLKVVKYPNRRLYSPDLNRYITLAVVGDYWDRDWEVNVFVHRTWVDVTIPTLLEVVRERVRSGRLRVTRQQLRALGAKA